MSRLDLRFDATARSRSTPLRYIFAACSLLVVGIADRAAAADWPLRGSITPTYTRWDGFYAGGQAGQSFSSADFSNATSSMASFILANTELQPILSNWTTLPNSTTGGISYGAFIGYNFQWEDVVMGGELNYDHMGLKNAAQNTIGPILVPGANLPDGSTVLYTVTMDSSVGLKITDVLTARGRAGWAIDRYLPYAFFGLAVARVDVFRTVDISGLKSTTPPPPLGGPVPPPVVGALNLPRNPQLQSTAGQIVYGYTAGLGIDIALLPNVFFRAEWEFIQFPNINDFRVAMNSVRGGLGVKF
jgi:outer membrane immunogenic protein